MATGVRWWKFAIFGVLALVIAIAIAVTFFAVIPPEFWRREKYFEIGKDENLLKCAVSALSRPSKLDIFNVDDERTRVYFNLKVPEYPKEIYGTVMPSAAAPIQIFVGAPGKDPPASQTRPVEEALTLITADLVTACKGREIKKSEWDTTR